jgi:hypothetical protein
LALAVASGSSYSKGFCSDCAPMNAAKSRVLAMEQRHEAVLRQLRLAPVADRRSPVGHFMSTPPSSVGNVWTAALHRTPRLHAAMREHHP